MHCMDRTKPVGDMVQGAEGYSTDIEHAREMQGAMCDGTRDDDEIQQTTSDDGWRHTNQDNSQRTERRREASPRAWKSMGGGVYRDAGVSAATLFRRSLDVMSFALAKKFVRSFRPGVERCVRRPGVQPV